MDFTATTSREIYGNREAHSTWETWCQLTLQPRHKNIADIGCGGGIYTRAFARLGAKSVVGIDSSEQYIQQAVKESSGIANLSFAIGDAIDTGLGPNSIDLVFERALIHHLTLDHQAKNIIEAKRILKVGGLLVVQDRTYEDVINDNPDYWIRSTLFKCFSELLGLEKSRRPALNEFSELLIRNGFSIVDVDKFHEVRRVYNSFEELKDEILSRKGKSILFELNNRELRKYCKKLEEIAPTGEIQESDQWTLWVAAAQNQ